jgi:invasion protein IalB
VSDADGRARDFRRLVAAAGLALLATSAARAQQAEPEDFGFGAWLVSCVDRGLGTVRCEMGQRVVSEDGSVQMLVATVAGSRDAPPVEIVFTTPLGVWLEPGALFRLAGAEQARTLVFERCALNGCFIYLALDDALRAQLAAGGFAEVRFADRLKRALAVPLALDGFADALAKLEAETGAGAAPKSRGVWGWLRRYGG